MTGDLMALGDHALDDTRPVLVDGALANVVTSDEEGSLGSPGFEEIEHTFCIDVRSVIISDGDSVGFVTSINTSSTILNISKLGTRIVASGGSIRSLISVTSGAEVDQAVRSHAMVFSSTAVSLELNQHVVY